MSKEESYGALMSTQDMTRSQKARPTLDRSQVRIPGLRDAPDVERRCPTRTSSTARARADDERRGCVSGLHGSEAWRMRLGADPSGASPAALRSRARERGSCRGEG